MSYKLLYISNARLPTEQAHGYQIGKMCEAFAHHKVKVTLYHPKRYQPNPELEETSIFDYYGLSNCFELKTLPNIDLLSLNDKLKLPSKISPYLIVLNYLSWGLYAVIEAKKEKADIYFTRDVSVAFWLTKFGLPTVLELHSINKKINKWLLKQIIKNSALKLFVVLTSFLKKELIELGCKSEKIHIAPDSVDLSLFENLPTKEECRQKLGLPQDKIIIGYLGRFRTMNMEKGIPELLQAVGKLPDNQKKRTFIVVCRWSYGCGSRLYKHC